MSDTTSNGAITGLRLLSKGFAPTINEVIIGRGRKVTNHLGNERFRDLIYSEISEYSAAENKTAKSAIIFRVLQEIKNGSPETGGFVKQDPKTKRWYAVEEVTGRTTTAQAFRDALSSTYKSSKQFKQQRRWDRRTPSTTPASASAATPIPTKDTTGKHDATTSGNVDILPKIPLAFEPCGAAARPKTQLEDILNCALETVGDLASFTSGIEEFGVPRSCGEANCSKEVDLDQLVDLLGLQPNACNPFEPTPISPALVNHNQNITHDMRLFPTNPSIFHTATGTLQPQMPPHLPMATTTLPPLFEPQSKETIIADNDHCGHWWENKLIHNNSFWQESRSVDPVPSVFSLRQALSSSSPPCRQCPI